MRVVKFRYENLETGYSQRNSVKMDNIELSDLNLLVGKNASGKSTVIRAISSFIRMITGRTLAIGKFYFELETIDLIIFKYTCQVSFDSEVKISEQLLKDDFVLIERSDTDAKIYSNAEQKLIAINPPNDRLISQVRRDEKEYPDLEQIIKWAENVHLFKFGHIHSSSFSKTRMENTSIDEDMNKILGDLSEDNKLKIIEDFNLLGYKIELINIRTQELQNFIYVKENALKYEIHQHSLSQGMYRSLFLLIFIHHLIEKRGVKMILIDDLCEGLDYDRASKLGGLLFKKLKEKNIQIIATSNDYFLMNVIDVKYWNIISRESSEIKVRNYRNSQQQFDRFMLSGLNNFDLFSSDFLN